MKSYSRLKNPEDSQAGNPLSFSKLSLFLSYFVDKGISRFPLAKIFSVNWQINTVKSDP